MVMHAAVKFLHPTSRVHELWQTDFTYFRVVGWGWYFLSTILDDYSRYIITWRLTTTMATADVTDTLEDALKATGLSEARVRHKPRLLSDTGLATVLAMQTAGSEYVKLIMYGDGDFFYYGTTTLSTTSAPVWTRRLTSGTMCTLL